MLLLAAIARAADAVAMPDLPFRFSPLIFLFTIVPIIF